MLAVISVIKIKKHRFFQKMAYFFRIFRMIKSIPIPTSVLSFYRVEIPVYKDEKLEKTLKRIEKVALGLKKHGVRHALFEEYFPYKEAFSMYGVKEYRSVEFERSMLLKAVRRICLGNARKDEELSLAIFDREMSFTDSKFLSELAELVKNVYLVTESKERAESLSEDVYDETGMPIIISESENIMRTADIILICSEGSEKYKSRINRRAIIFDTISKIKTDFNASIVIKHFDYPLPKELDLFGAGILNSDAAEVLYGLYGFKELLKVPESGVIKNKRLKI